MDTSDGQSSSAFHSLLACEVEQRSSGNYSNHWRDSQRRRLEVRCRSQTRNRNETLPETRTLRIETETFQESTMNVFWRVFVLQYLPHYKHKRYIFWWSNKNITADYWNGKARLKLCQLIWARFIAYCLCNASFKSQNLQRISCSPGFKSFWKTILLRIFHPKRQKFRQLLT